MGAVIVTLFSCSNLPIADLVTSDPFVEFKLGDVSCACWLCLLCVSAAAAPVFATVCQSRDTAQGAAQLGVALITHPHGGGPAVCAFVVSVCLCRPPFLPASSTLSSPAVTAPSQSGVYCFLLPPLDRTAGFLRVPRCDVHPQPLLEPHLLRLLQGACDRELDGQGVGL